VEQHVAKCPAAQRKAVAESAPYYCLNINLPGPVAAASAAAAASCAQAGPSSSGGGGGGAAAAAGEAKKRGGEKGEGDEGQPQQKKRKRRQQPPSIFASMRADEVDALVALVRTAHALHCREPLQTVMLRHPPCEPHFTPAKGYHHPNATTTVALLLLLLLLLPWRMHSSVPSPFASAGGGGA
jgi:hypothetical protein